MGGTPGRFVECASRQSGQRTDQSLHCPGHVTSATLRAVASADRQRLLPGSGRTAGRRKRRLGEWARPRARSRSRRIQYSGGWWRSRRVRGRRGWARRQRGEFGRTRWGHRWVGGRCWRGRDNECWRQPRIGGNDRHRGIARRRRDACGGWRCGGHDARWRRWQRRGWQWCRRHARGGNDGGRWGRRGRWRDAGRRWWRWNAFCGRRRRRLDGCRWRARRHGSGSDGGDDRRR
jgi:hypothetical protein